VRWFVSSVESEGKLTNLSATGCYVSAANDLRVGDVVEVELTVPGRLTVSLRGPVARLSHKEGFALRFRRLSATQELLLEHAVWHLSAELEHNRPIRERLVKERKGSAAPCGRRPGGRPYKTAA
jgi:hypothetical protein